MAHSLINKLLVTIRAFCRVITGDVERLLILMVYGRALQAAADRLFAWTALLRLRGDDGQKEVVSQSWPLLPVPTGVIPHLLLHRGNAQLKQLHGDDVCLCLYRCLDGGLIAKGGSLVFNTPSLSKLWPLRVSVHPQIEPGLIKVKICNQRFVRGNGLCLHITICWESICTPCFAYFFTLKFYYWCKIKQENTKCHF